MDLPGQEVDGIMMQEKFLQIKILNFQFPLTSNRSKLWPQTYKIFTEYVLQYLYESILFLKSTNTRNTSFVYENNNMDNNYVQRVLLYHVTYHGIKNGKLYI
jgi:hypothetical protein